MVGKLAEKLLPRRAKASAASLPGLGIALVIKHLLGYPLQAHVPLAFPPTVDVVETPGTWVSARSPPHTPGMGSVTDPLKRGQPLPPHRRWDELKKGEISGQEVG